VFQVLFYLGYRPELKKRLDKAIERKLAGLKREGKIN